MIFKQFSNIVEITVICMVIWTSGGINSATNTLDFSLVQTDISKVSVPETIKVVGLGEASHGVKEYHQMKEELFKALVLNHGCRTFIIEGDFGGALKVDAYIHGGTGSAEDVVKEIGFSIYNTQEMVALIDWMRLYNENAPIGDDLHFYGMDMQRFDNNKEFLFSALDASVPELSEKYKTTFMPLTDETRLNLSTDVLDKAKIDAIELLKELDHAEKEIVANIGQTDFDFARECANTIYSYTDILLSSDKSYNTLRDQYMFEKMVWFLQIEDNLIFMNGHNGHIGKTSVSNYTCLGELLSNSIGKNYFAIGTDAALTTFNSQNDNGSFRVIEVKNQNLLNRQTEYIDDNFYYIDFTEVENNKGWNDICKSQLPFTSLNVGITDWQKSIKSFYTTTIVPKDTYDGMIIFQKVSPTTLLST